MYDSKRIVHHVLLRIAGCSKTAQDDPWRRSARAHGPHRAGTLPGRAEHEGEVAARQDEAEAHGDVALDQGRRVDPAEAGMLAVRPTGRRVRSNASTTLG